MAPGPASADRGWLPGPVHRNRQNGIQHGELRCRDPSIGPDCCRDCEIHTVRPLWHREAQLPVLSEYLRAQMADALRSDALAATCRYHGREEFRGQIHRQAIPARKRCDTGKVIAVLVGYQYCREISGRHTEPRHASLGFFDGKAAVHQQTLVATGDQCTVSFTAASQ